MTQASKSSRSSIPKVSPVSTNILDGFQLDDFQKAFCMEPEQAVRMLAPAGSGKTYSLLFRCLAKSKAVTDGNVRFLIFTFTRAARDELRDRLTQSSQFSSLQPYMEITTLNSWGYRWLKTRLHNPRLITGTQDRKFTLMNMLQPVWKKHPHVEQVMVDSRRKNKAANEIMDIMDRLKSLGFRHDKHTTAQLFRDHLQWVISHGMGPHVVSTIFQFKNLEIIDRQASDADLVDLFYKNFFQFWREAVLQMYQSAVITLEDQKYLPVIEIERAIADGRVTTGMHRYNHILVDEFQDINVLDLNLLKIVAAQNKSELTIVGDDDQAIYEWRGATPEFILKPDELISNGYKTHILEVNYRSPRNIVELSQRLIKHNKRRVDKRVVPASREEAHVEVLVQRTLEESVEFVTNVVQDLLEDPNIRNIALISRKRSQIIPYQIVFAGKEMPFYAAEDLHVLLSDAFTDLKSMLLLKAQANSPLPFGPDPVESILKLCDKVKHYPLSRSDKGSLKAWLLSKRPRTLVQANDALYEYTGALKGFNTGGAMSEDFYNRIRQLLLAGTVSEAIRAISESFDGLQKNYGRSLDDIFYADPPFLYLADYAVRYGTDFGQFYEDIEKAIATLVKMPPVDEEPVQPDETRQRPLHLMTALRAKGKEFDAVIILDANNGVWPSRLAQSEAELEQERRLFYVAMTRARKRLFFLVNERILDEVMAPSPYLYEAGLIK